MDNEKEDDDKIARRRYGAPKYKNKCKCERVLSADLFAVCLDELLVGDVAVVRVQHRRRDGSPLHEMRTVG